MATLTELPLVQAPEPESDRSYQKLAARIAGLITEGEFKAGDRLPSERALAERFNVSRTLVREALVRLSQEGLVELRPNRGAVVARPSLEEGHHLFTTRLAL